MLHSLLDPQLQKRGLHTIKSFKTNAVLALALTRFQDHKTSPVSSLAKQFLSHRLHGMYNDTFLKYFVQLHFEVHSEYAKGTRMILVNLFHKLTTSAEHVVYQNCSECQNKTETTCCGLQK